MEAKEKVLKRVKKNIYVVVIRLFIIFSLPAFVGLFLGRLLDNTFNIKPWGSFGLLFIFYTLTWIGIVVFHKKIMATIDETEKDSYPNAHEASTKKKNSKKINQ